MTKLKEHFNYFSKNPHIQDKRDFMLKCNYSSNTGDRVIEHSGYKVAINHKKGDSDGVNRIWITQGELKLELLPSKGLSIGQAFYKNQAIFWDPPLENLSHPETIDWDAPLIINEEEVYGFQWISTFTGGIEMLGLENWGMPVKKAHKHLSLHGEISNIPVEEVYTFISNSGIEIAGSFYVRDWIGNKDTPWYDRGKILYKITKKIILEKDTSKIMIFDQITNKSKKKSRPDWGYHVQFFPEENAEYLVPSTYIQNRCGNEILKNFEKWHPAKKEKEREEIGFIHKSIQITHKAFPDNDDGIKTLLRYPDGRGIVITVPPVPYFQTWYSSGGKNGSGFMLPGNVPLLRKNWDGMGPEFGSSALDHDGNIEKGIKFNTTLNPGETLGIKMVIEIPDIKESMFLAEQIKEYQVLALNNEFYAMEKETQALSEGLLEIVQGNFNIQLKQKFGKREFAVHENLTTLFESLKNVKQHLLQSIDYINILTSPKSERICYVGAESYLEGTMCGNEMVRLLNKKGKVAVVTAWFKEIGINQRMKGFENTLKEIAPEIKIVEYAESHFDINLACQLTIDILNKHPDLAGIYATEANSPIGVAIGVEKAGFAGKVKIVGHDCLTKTMHYVKQGIISSTLSQDPVAQGYNPLIFLYNKIVEDKNPPKISMLTDIVMVNNKNYSEYWDEEKGLIETDESLKRLAQPVEKIPEKQLKLAMITREALEFDQQIKQGMQLAKKILLNRNTKVDWIVPCEGADSSAEIFGPVIQDCIKKGYDGIATMAHDWMFVPFINEAVAKGVPVVTFNSDPYSLKESIENIYEQSNQIIKLKNEMEIAKQIQTAILPTLKNASGFEITASMIPADDVGGDYYDFYLEENNKQFYCIGDVSGHGVTAGLIMLMTQSTICSIIKMNPDIGLDVLYSTVNKVLYENIQHRLFEDHYMTLSLLVTDLRGNYDYIGSHLPVIVYRHNNNKCEQIESSGFWVGMIEDVSQTIEKKAFKLSTGDILLLYTDGITEARSNTKELYDVERLQNVLKKNHQEPVKTIKEAILNEVFSFMDVQKDDITLFLIKKV